ncbi:MAG: AsnC family transcriptional regulator [Thermoprotei archaeon]|nr:MAG: AsnC family transcriptional regulator [Thermoprotei archaeon]
MSYSYAIDELDIKILNALLRNSRISYRRLARELSIGESTVYSRINKLINLGILKGFTVIVDYERAGLGVEAFVEVKVKPKDLSDVINQLREAKGVIAIYEVSGEYPLLLRIAAKSNEELVRIIDELGNLESILDINIKYVLRKYENPQSLIQLLE